MPTLVADATVQHVRGVVDLHAREPGVRVIRRHHYLARHLPGRHARVHQLDDIARHFARGDNDALAILHAQLRIVLGGHRFEESHGRAAAVQEGDGDCAVLLRRRETPEVELLRRRM